MSRSVSSGLVIDSTRAVRPPGPCCLYMTPAIDSLTSSDLASWMEASDEAMSSLKSASSA